MGLPGLGKVWTQIYNNARDEQSSILNKPGFPTQQKTVCQTKIFSVKTIFFNFENWEENRIKHFLRGILLKSASEFGLRVCGNANQQTAIRDNGCGERTLEAQSSWPSHQIFERNHLCIFMFLFQTSLKQPTLASNLWIAKDKHGALLLLSLSLSGCWDSRHTSLVPFPSLTKGELYTFLSYRP